MNITLTSYQLQKLLSDASELGALKAYLKKSEAFRRFGRTKVEQWISQGLITPRKDGNHSAAWRIDRIEIEIIYKAKSAMSFF